MVAGIVPGGNFATKMALFGAELPLRRSFAPEMALFDAERCGMATLIALMAVERVQGKMFCWYRK